MTHADWVADNETHQKSAKPLYNQQ